MIIHPNHHLKGDWIPKASSHAGFSFDNLNNNLNSIDQQTDYEIQFIVHRDSRCQRLCSSKSPLYSLGTNDMSWCYRIWRRWTLQTPWPWVCCSIKSALLTMLWKASSTGTSKKFVDPKDPFQPFTVHWKKQVFVVENMYNWNPIHINM